MIRYLNRAEKEYLDGVGAFVNFFEAMIEQMEKCTRPKVMIKWAKMAKSFAVKIIDYYRDNLEPGVYEKLLKEVAGWKIQICYTDQAKREHAKTLEIKDNVVIHKDELALICDRALAFCRLCNRHGQAVEDCKLRQILMSGWVDPVNQEAGTGDCQYRERSEE